MKYVKLTKTDRELIKSMGRWTSDRIKDDTQSAKNGFITELERKMRRPWYKSTMFVLVHKVACQRTTARSKEKLAQLHRKWNKKWGK